MKHIYTTLLFSFLLVSVSGFSQFTDGVFILNEGGAGSGNASVSYLSNTATGVQNNIYGTVNPTQGTLGDTAQSLSFEGQNAYIVLNISNTLTSWQIGMYGFMAIAHFLIFGMALGVRLETDTPEFWFMMQIAMICGFATAYPVNWWLLRSGIKEPM